jgi:hypothetical protein
MEIHPDAYDDPEEDNDWVTPSLPDPSTVPDNTHSWWVFYHWWGTPNPAQKKVSLALTREITAPWRRGAGIMVRHKKNRADAIGVWTRGKAPNILSDAPAEKDWQDVVARADHLERGLEHN